MEDDPLVRHALVKVLDRLEFDVQTAPDGVAGLALVRQAHFDLAMVDMMMPHMGGIEVIPILKADFPELPVIVCSGMDSGKDVISAINLGAWDYILKPVTDLGILQHALNRCLERADLLRENRRYREHLEQEIDRRAGELKERSRQLELEVETRKQAQAEVTSLNRELEARVEERTRQLLEVNRELNETLRKLKDDEIAGRRIQFQLLPPTHRTIGEFNFSHFLAPSTYLSGDFLDYFVIDDDHIGFYIADVSGHGVSSAFVTVLLKSFMGGCLQRYRETGDPVVLHPGALLARLNREIIDQNIDKYLTIFYGVIDRRDLLFTFCNGGQFPFPVLVSGNTTEIIREKGFPVGMFEFSDFEDATLSLPDDFMLYLVSDGIFDLLPPTDDLAARDALLVEQLTSCGEAIENLTKQFNLNPDTSPEEIDDITFLCVRKRGSGIES
jgi:phosphoserine phosphatase RsbU/P